MRYPTWNDFVGKYPDNPQDAFEALCRLLFRTKYGIGDNLPYFFNNAGNETVPITVGNDVIGFQSKFFDGSTIDSSQAGQIKHSIETAHRHYPQQTKIIVYTNSTFANPVAGTQNARKKDIDDTAKANNMTIEWMYGDNILDVVSKNSLANNLFFDSSSNLSHLPSSIKQSNDLNLGNITSNIKFRDREIIIDRTKEISDLKEHISRGENVIVYGESGSGKSSIVKNFCKEIIDDDNKVFYFTRGIQYDTKSIDELFQMDEAYRFANFRDFYDGFDCKIVVIDSAERLTEIGNLAVLQLLLEGLNENGWQFIFTCKGNSYDALKQLLKEIKIKTEDLKVDILQEVSLKEIGESYSIDLPQNEKMFRQLRIPFYLARYCELGGFEVSTPEAFREAVWSKKVWGSIKGGIQQRREKCLLQVAEEQQMLNAFYVIPDHFDDDAAFQLVQEDVLLLQEHRGYAIKHDIYVDWALDYKVENDFSTEDSCLRIMQAEPISITYLNAFSRWFSNRIDTDDPRIPLIIDSFINGKISKRWDHCILTAIGCSNKYASVFFRKYNDNLKVSNYALFDRFVGILDVSCKIVSQYIEYKGDSIPIYKSIGKGWDEAVLFVDINKEDYYLNHLGAVQKLLKGYVRYGDKALARDEASRLSLRIFDIVAEARIQKKHFWFENSKPWCELVCQYAIGIRNELEARFDQVISNLWVRHSDPYSELVDYILKDSDNLSKTMLLISCQKSVIALMNLFWREQPKNNKINEFPYVSHGGEDVFGLNSDFGIEMAYFPASPFQTPVGTMLDTEQFVNPKGSQVLDFIIDFVNGSIDYYCKRDNTGERTNISVKLRDGSLHDVVTSQSLWNLYRGTSNFATTHLLTSMHMALEKWLLDLTDKKEKTDWAYVETLLWKILENSQSSSLYAIVASIALAHPDELFDILMFLCQDIRFLALDLHRYTMEISADMNLIGFHRHQVWGDERVRSNKLPHRQQHLEGMLLMCQYTYDNTPSEEFKHRLDVAFKVVDNLKKQVEDSGEVDKTYRFILARIDYRSYEKKDVTLNNGAEAVQLTPVLAPELVEEKKRAEELNNRLGAVGLRVWADKRFNGQEGELKGNQYVENPKIVLGAIKAIEKQITEHTKNQILLPGDEYVPYSASAVLLMFEQEQLCEEEKQECWDRVMLALNSLGAMASNSLSELNICIAAIPTLIDMFPTRISDFVPIISTYSMVKEEFINQRICDLMSDAICKGQLWIRYPGLMNDVLKRIKENDPSEDWDAMNAESADSVLCLLTYSPIESNRHLGRICVEKLSRYWQKSSRYEHFDGKYHIAENVAKYILYAPKEEVETLIGPYVNLLDFESYSEPLITQFIMGAPQYNKYENFWIVWNALYKSVIEKTSRFYQNSFLNEYLLNPLFFPKDYDDWFLLQEKDIDFYQKVVNDIGGHPTVLYALSRVFATIGKSYSKRAILLFSDIIEKHNPALEDTKTQVVFYVEKICKKFRLENESTMRVEIQLKKKLLVVLKFLRDNGSQLADNMIKNL